MEPFQSPLRYPGGKNGLVNYFEATLKENLLLGTHLHEVYAGGAAISLGMLSRDVIAKATLVERDPLVYSFWKAVKFYPEELCQEISRCKITLTTWKAFHRYLAPTDSVSQHSIVKMGFAGLFLNRTNFSGIIDAGPIGGMEQKSDYLIDCRFNKKRIIEQITHIATLGPKLSVVFSDAVSYLRKHGTRILDKGGIAYLDPPYYQQGQRLYRYSYGKDDHRRLATLITQAQYPWIVSYDNHPYIRRLFAGQKIVPISLNYAVKESRKATELLISNIKLSKPTYESKSLKELGSPVRRLKMG
jgi:DNA adenine methylase